MAEKTKKKPVAFDIATEKSEPKKALSPELEKQIKNAEKRLDAKPDAPKKEEKKSDVAMPKSELPPEFEREIESYVKAESRANFEFMTTISAYMKKSMNKYGVSSDSKGFVSGLKTEMIGAYSSIFVLNQADKSALEAALTFGKGTEEGPGAALALHFRQYTGFDYALQSKLSAPKKLTSQMVQQIVMGTLDESIKTILLDENKQKFVAALGSSDDKDLDKFRQIPISMMKKLGLEDQIEKDSFKDKGQIGSVYAQLLVDYIGKVKMKYLN